MVLKTFNLDERVYKKYSAHCKANGISMSKQVDKFIAQEIERVAIKSLWSSSPHHEAHTPASALPPVSGAEKPQRQLAEAKTHHSMRKYC